MFDHWMKSLPLSKLLLQLLPLHIGLNLITFSWPLTGTICLCHCPPGNCCASNLRFCQHCAYYKLDDDFFYYYHYSDNLYGVIIQNSVVKLHQLRRHIFPSSLLSPSSSPFLPPGMSWAGLFLPSKLPLHMWRSGTHLVHGSLGPPE